MKKYFLLLSLSCLMTAAAEKSGEYAFHLAGRDFTHKEALELAGGRSDFKTAVQANIAAAAAIVLFSRENIELSARRTRDFLQKNLMLMPVGAQQDFRNMLVRSGLTQTAWLEREKNKLSNQLSEAVVRWYTKVYGEKSPVTDEHVRNWYYRNIDIFRRIKLDPSKVLAFKIGDSAKMEKALAALRQAVPIETVRLEFAENLSEAAMLEEFHSTGIKRRNSGDGYWFCSGSKHLFLVYADAVKYTALPLDDNLKKAISNTLQEALAKARLAETLKRELQGKKIIFY